MRSLPPARGEITEWLLGALTEETHELPLLVLPPISDPLSDEDLQLALYLCYELHYRGLPGVSERWEWEPSLLRARRELENRFEEAMRAAVLFEEVAATPQDMAVRLRAVAESEEQDGVSLSRYMRSHADMGQVLEFFVHRSAYQLKEADPHSWAIPRLSGPPKAALVEIQADEYGGGRPDWMHAELFARAMRAVGLDSAYGAYLDLIPGVTLATVNLMSLFGLHRRLRGALVGHLALFEMTSSIPNRRYARGLRRLGLGGEATLFFDEHVEADAVHENIAAVDLAGGLVRQDPSLGGAVLWGARSLALLDQRWADYVVGRWESGRSSLLGPLEAPALAGSSAPVLA